jgi:hypothetical protein
MRQPLLVAANVSTGLVPELKSKYLSIRFGMDASAPFPDKGRSYLPGGALVTDIAVFGYAGNGIAQGSIVGHEVAEWMTTGDRQCVRVPPARAKSIPSATASRHR